MKKAYIFPGQGSQCTGMARELYENLPSARSMMDEANRILGFSITEVMFYGSGEELRATKVTQPAIFIHSVVLAKHWPGFQPDMVAGHSLGEFSALAAAGAMDFGDALRLVAVRARQMQLCCEARPGTMAAVIGLRDEAVEELCRSCEGTVVPANCNCPGQVVISGETQAVAQACAKAKEAGAKRALPLSVGGAFHSPLMQPAALELGKAIEATEIRRPLCPVYQNATARPSTDPAEIKRNLLAQLTAPVLWSESVAAMLEDGATDFTELGPGNVLQGLVKRIAAGREGISAQSFSTVQ